MTTAEQKAHPVVTGIAEAAGNLTTPESALMILGTAGFGEPRAAGKAIIPRLISSGFSAQALKGAYYQVPAFKNALSSGYTPSTAPLLPHIPIHPVTSRL